MSAVGQLPLLAAPAIPGGRLLRVGRRDPLVVELANRHYSRARPADAVGSPARSLVLRDREGQVAFVWTWPRDGYRRDRQAGANCELFRNESPWRSSDLLLEAERVVAAAWSVVRLFTYVDPQRAGRRRDGQSASGKVRLVKDLRRP